MKSGSRVRRALGALCLGLLICVSGFDVAASPPPAESEGSAITPVDVNRATAEELTSVPGIGPAMAARIVEFREEHGPFRRIEDLLKIRGIGEKSFQKLRPYLVVGKKRN